MCVRGIRFSSIGSLHRHRGETRESHWRCADCGCTVASTREGERVFLRDLASLCALSVIGNGNLSGGDKPLEQSCDITPDHVGRSAIPAPNRHFWAKSSRTSGPAHQVVGEKAKLLRRLQTLENSILIRVHVQNLRFSHPMFSLSVPAAAKLSADTRPLNFNRRFGCASLPQPCIK
jgi:hypothetical protein